MSATDCYYPNLTTLRSGLCYRKSVCCLSASSVTFVRPTQGVETFGNISSPFCTLAIFWPQCKIFRRSSQGNPSVGALNARGVAKYRDVTFVSLICWRVSCFMCFQNSAPSNDTLLAPGNNEEGEWVEKLIYNKFILSAGYCLLSTMLLSTQ